MIFVQFAAVRGHKMGVQRSISAAVAATFALCVAGCVNAQLPENDSPPDIPKGRYTDFREMAYSRIQTFSVAGMPDKLMSEFRTCMIDTLYPYYTKAEIERLDAYARGENQLSAAEYDQIDTQMRGRLGGKEATKAALRATCPDTMKEAEAGGFIVQ
jgi:hypothetical protein